jgi:hypothetical protein
MALAERSEGFQANHQFAYPPMSSISWWVAAWALLASMPAGDSPGSGKASFLLGQACLQPLVACRAKMGI